MTGLASFTCTPRQVRKHIIKCMVAGLVPFIQSSPAMGKSAIVHSIAKEYNLKLIDHRLSTSAPEDLTGLPQFTNGKATFAPFDFFPTEDMEVPAGYQGWLLFLDEFNSATKAIQAAAYKLVLDRMTGQKKLHKKVVIVCAGNLSTDRAIVNNIGTAMQSRLIHLTMELNHQEFMEDVAFKNNWDRRIIAFLSYKPNLLHDFSPEHADKTFCAPRTWEFMNKLIKGNEIKDEDAALYAGAISSGVAVEFIQFVKVFDSLPQIGDIVRNPETVPVPGDAATRYAAITHLIEYSDKDNLDKIGQYIKRFTPEFKILFFRGLFVRKPELKKHEASVEALVDLYKFVNDEEAAAA